MPEDQPDTAGHTITGDRTIPADATVKTRESIVAKTLRGDLDDAPHHCSGCDGDFDSIGTLLEHDCEEAFGGPDPDDDNDPGSDPIAMTDGGVVPEITAEEFQRLQNKRSTTDRDEQPQCENCGSIALSPKNQNALGTSREFEEPYQCRNCGEHVEGNGGDA